MINIHDVLVGDVLHLEPEDMIPTDSIFINGSEVKCDESSATRESDQLNKTSGEQVIRLLEAGHHDARDLDPFIISGAKVLEGIDTYLVTSVGVNSSFGKIMMSVRQDAEATPLQKKLGGLATAIAKLGGSAALLLFFVLLFRFLASLSGDNRSGAEKASSFMDILIVAITVIVVAVLEGLPLAVTLALAFATTRLLKENNLVRVLRAYETMGNATTVCSDKTGTLTTNKMTVVAGTFGNSSFDEKESRISSTRPADFARSLLSKTNDLITQSVAINSTAFEGEEDRCQTFIRSKTETALLQFAQDYLAMDSLTVIRANASVVQQLPFDSKNKYMGAVVKLPSGQYRLLIKGASEVLLKLCTQIVDIENDTVTRLLLEIREALKARITTYAKDSLRIINLTYQDFPQWPSVGTASSSNSEEADIDLVLKTSSLTFLGVVSIQDPVRLGVPEAVRKAQRASVVVRIVTGDNAGTAQAIATEYGIYNGGGLIMEGPTFRTLSDVDMAATLPRLQVLARSSPEDKRILVQKLKAIGETVAVTGNGTNDAPALKTADIGFSMGITGTEVAKEASSIMLMDDNFASILTALMWGRAVNDAIQKFLQVSMRRSLTYLKNTTNNH